MSSSGERERRLRVLGNKLGYGLDEDFKRAGTSIRDSMIREFEREIVQAEAFANQNDLFEAAYHRSMAYAINNTLKDLESMMVNLGVH
jgi:hypothetical protein